MAARQLVRGVIIQGVAYKPNPKAGPTETLLIQGIGMLRCSDFAFVGPQCRTGEQSVAAGGSKTIVIHLGGKTWKNMMLYNCYPLVMTNIAMENGHLQ